MKKIRIVCSLISFIVLFVPVFASAREPLPEPNPPHIEKEEQPRSQKDRGFPRGAPTTEWVYHKTADHLHPNGPEQKMMWLMNRARSNPTQEGIWLATSTSPYVADGRNYFSVNLTMLQNEFASYSAKPPAAYDRRLYEAAKAHCDDLITRDAQDHINQDARVLAAGYSYSSYRGNVFSYADNGLNAHAAFNIDWGYDAGGMQSTRGHRKAIMSLDGDYSNVGIAIVPNSIPSNSIGPKIVTGNYCAPNTYAANHYARFIVGTVWRDTDGDDEYDNGEGKSGVTVMPDQGTFYAVTANSGAFSIPITQSGTYVLTLSGASLSGDRVISIYVGSDSTWANIDLTDYPPVTPTPTPTPPPTPPSVPGNMQATDGTGPNRVFISWNTATGAAWYQVWRNTVNNTVTATLIGNNIPYNSYTDNNSSPGVTYYYWVKAVNVAGSSGFSFPNTGYCTGGTTASIRNDLDGDGFSDLIVYSVADGKWYIRKSGDGTLYAGAAIQFGWSGALPTTGDFDGDQVPDLGVYDLISGEWYISQSTDGQLFNGTPLQWGWSGGYPAPGDYDGDQLADITVYDLATGNWYIRSSSTGQLMAGSPIQWGWSGALPSPGDFDGDGITDIAVYDVATGDWYIRQSHDDALFSGAAFQWGWSGALPAQADYDGDGVTDIAVYNQLTGEWYIRQSSDGLMYSGGIPQWGWGGAIPSFGGF